MQAKILFIFFTLFSTPLATPYFNEFIVWNIGQGQWLTYSESNICKHFDTGGEFWNNRNIFKYCSIKQNEYYFSHADNDHINFALRAMQFLPRLCIQVTPLDHHKKIVQRILDKINPCAHKDTKFMIYQNDSFKNSNDSSHVFAFKHFLIPGDSSSHKEKEWASRLPKDLNFLILGHHGSRTSTSNYLLDHLPKLKQAISSSRFVRYGHPHLEVQRRLAYKKIPLLRTEDWGNIHFVLKNL